MIGFLAPVALILQAAGPLPDHRVPPPLPPVGECLFAGPWIVFFGRDSSALTDETKAILDHTLGDYCRRIGPPRLELIGHSDGGERPGISARRAASVRRYLRERGIRAGDLTIKDLGSSRPRVPIRRGVPNVQNRRVELVVGLPSE